MAWSYPIAGRYEITADFGDAGPQWENDHTGVDFGAASGTAVLAVDDGIVIYIGRSDAYGNIVKIRHAGVDSWYAHLSEISVRPLQRVTRGQRIGAVGATGNATGPHLHLEARIAGVPVDPKRFLSGVAPVGREVDGDGSAFELIPGVGPLFAFAGGIQNVIGFVTDPQNWLRVGLFIGGVVVLLLAVVVARREAII